MTVLAEHLAILPEDVRARVVRAEVRSERMRALSVLWSWSNNRRIRRCIRTVADKSAPVGLGLSEGVASMQNVQRCASVHSCPACGPRIRQGRAVEIKEAGTKHLGDGGGLLFVTLTVPHQRRDALSHLWKAVAGAWSDVIGSPDWRDLEEWYGGVRIKGRDRIGVIRAFEGTYGQHGWHPHLHNLLFVPGGLSDDQVSEIEAEIYALWSRAVQVQGLGEPSAKHGIDVQRVESVGDLGEYLAGLDGTRVDLELARGDLKRSKRGGRSPWQILRDLADGGDRDDLLLWWEWERASWRKNHVTWSQGLKGLYGVGEVSDEELASEATGHVDVLMVGRAAWRAVTGRRLVAPLLSALEREDRAAAIAVLELANAPLWAVWWADDPPG